VEFLAFLALAGYIGKRWGIKGLATYGAVAYVVDVPIRRGIAASEARAYSDSVGKPMLNVGSGGGSFWTSVFKSTTYGDVNIDLSAPKGSPCGPDTVCWGDAQDLSKYPDKYFGAVLATHILEHVEDPQKALSEWHRVADRVYVVVPKWWAPHTWLYTQHYWYVADDKAYPLWDGSGKETRVLPASV
jgi:SAM-dependent methyltransferase